MGTFIDVLLVVVVLFYIFLGYKRGFTRSLLSVCVKMVSFTGGLFASSKFAPMLYDSYFKAGVVRNIESRMYDDTSVALSEQVTTAVNSIPNVLAGIAKIFDIDITLLEEKIKSASIPSDIATSLEEVVVGPVVIGICRIVIFAVVSAVASVVIGAVVNVICGFVRIPVLKKGDELLGMLLGLVNGVFTTIVLSYFMVIVASLIDSEEVVKFVDSSIFVDIFANINLFI